MKDVSGYIDKLLKSSQLDLTDFDKEKIKELGLSEWILSRFLSKKFRKTKAHPDCIERTRKAIEMRMKRKEPIKVVFPQGGYKLWRLPSSPEVDWAEFFNISYLLEFIAPIAAAYKHGVEIEYYMHTLLMEKHDNLSTEEIAAYVESFRKLIKVFEKFLPRNVKISILRDADIYSRDEYFQALESGLKGAKKIYDAFDDNKKEDYRRMSLLNIKWDGVEDWTKFGEKKREKQLEKSALYEISAVNNLPKVVERVKADSNVLVFTVATPMFIGIGSTKTSVAKYWTGFGVLEKKEERYLERVLSPAQFEKVKNQKHKVVKVDAIPLKNFKEIWVYNKRFDFVR